MALFHLNVTQIKRSKGQSAIAAAAYRAGEKLYSEYYGETSDYSNKGGVICSEILLPDHAPREYTDRQTLWNTVEKAERGKNAQLAYSFDIALQNEFSLDENIALARQFLLDHFVSRGMVVDFAIHVPDTEPGGISNPHFHVMTPIRPIDESGKWGCKQHRVYELDENGNRLLDTDGNYIFNAVPTTDWGSPETLEYWWEQWAAMCNAKFEEQGLPERIDYRSYERQGVDTLPTIHERPAVRQMEAKGIRTDKGEFNRWIKATNSVIREIKKKINALLDWLKDAKEELSKPNAPDLFALLQTYYDQRNAGAYSQRAKINNLKEYSELCQYLLDHNIHDLETLETHVGDLQTTTDSLKKKLDAQTAELKMLRKIPEYYETHKQLKPIFDGLQKIKFTKAREKYKADHAADLKRFYEARRIISQKFPDGKFDRKALEAEYAELERQHDATYTQFKAIRAESQTLWKIKSQKAILKRYAKEQGFRNIQFFVDDGFSGANFNRPEWQRMISMVEADQIGVLLAKDMSRIGRNYLEVGFYTEILFPKHNVRFIAINSGVDSANQMDNDFTPFLNIINEFYVKDSSKKVKASMKQKGESGEYLTTNPPYGYMKDPDNPKKHWIIDDEAAAIVRQIFSWCMEGYGPSQIAKKLKEAKVDCPTVHWAKMGRNAPAKTPEDPYDWVPRTISGILERQEYLGHMVNFRTHRQSYKSKKKIENPQSEWKIFENTHDAIVDEETFYRVQELRKNKRRPTRTGKSNMFSGVVRCADCGEKLYYCTSKNFEARQDHFICSTTRRRGPETCTSHFIRAVVLEEGTLRHMQVVISCIASHEDTFRKTLGAKRNAEVRKELAAKRRMLQKSENRLAELDRLFKRIYEDMVNGKLTEARFQMLADDYEQEQAELREKIDILEDEIQRQEDQTENVDKFIRQAKKYLHLEKLTPAVLNDLVKAVYVHAPDNSSGHRVQDVEISYNYIGILPATLLYDLQNGKTA